MSARPLVSVVIDNYNYAEFLRSCIDSALAQSYSNLEVIVVDDGSTDGSREIIESYGSAVRPILKENGGQASAFNAGVAEARGEILCFLDSDDRWYPHKVERVVEVLAADAEIGWLRHRMQMIDAAGRPIPLAVPAFSGTRRVRPVPMKFIEGRFPVLTSGMSLRREVAARVFPIPLTATPYPGHAPVSLRYDADAYVAFRAAASGRELYSLDEILGEYRRHDRQQYIGPQDVRRIVERQIHIAAGASSAFSAELGGYVTPTSVFKHRAILAAMDGHRLWDSPRGGAYVAGLRQALRLLRVDPRVAVRQALALSFGFLAPALWTRRLMRTGGYPAQPGGAAGGGA